MAIDFSEIHFHFVLSEVFGNIELTCRAPESMDFLLLGVKGEGTAEGFPLVVLPHPIGVLVDVSEEAALPEVLLTTGTFPPQRDMGLGC